MCSPQKRMNANMRKNQCSKKQHHQSSHKIDYILQETPNCMETRSVVKQRNIKIRV